MFDVYRRAQSGAHPPQAWESHVLRSNLFVGLSTQGAAAAMFPFEDEHDDLHWDEYGAALRPDEFQLKAASRAGQNSLCR